MLEGAELYRMYSAGAGDISAVPLRILAARYRRFRPLLQSDRKFHAGLAGVKLS